MWCEEVVCLQPWLAVGDIEAAIGAAQEEAAAAGSPSDLVVLRLKPVREALANSSATSHKLMSQEQAWGERLGVSLTYCQIKLVLGCLQRNFNLAALVTETPPPILEILEEDVTSQTGSDASYIPF